MSDPQSGLGEARYARVFRDEIIPKSDIKQTTSHEIPRAIVLAGQPGAGKGNMKRAARRELDWDVVAIDPDELRDYNPEVNRFRELHPYTWSGDTHPFASRAANELRELAVQQKKNVIIDTTLDHPSKP